MLAEWWGARNGRRLVSAPPSIAPATEAIIGDFEQFGGRQRRQDRGQPCREHRLAGPGRTDHQEVVAAGGGDLQCTLGAFLALDVDQVEQGAFRLAHLGLRSRQHLGALEMVGELDQRAGGDNLHLRARPCRLRPAAGRADPALAAGIGADRRRQHAGHCRNRAVEAKLAQDRVAAERIMGDRSDCGHQPERDRQVVMAAFLGEVRRGEVDRNPPRRQREARCHQRGAYPFAGLRYRLVRQPHHVEGGNAGRDLDLDIDRAGLDALERDRGYTLDHEFPRRSAILT
jgi:hypothetical protein